MYAISCTRPNIALAVSVTSRYQSNPNEEHSIAVKNIISTSEELKIYFFIFIRGSELRVEDFTNSGFMFDPDDRKSMLGYVFVCNGDAVS